MLTDVNVLGYTHREDASGHAAYRWWLEGMVNGDEAYAISELVLSGFIRVVTHIKIFKRPSTVADAFDFCDQRRERPNSAHVAPDAMQFTRL